MLTIILLWWVGVKLIAPAWYMIIIYVAFILEVANIIHKARRN